jgi:hypothetical protein
MPAPTHTKKGKEVNEMKAILIAAAAVVASLALGASAAPAKQTGSLWMTPQRAAQILYVNDIEWQDGSQSTVVAAVCRGLGRRIGTRFRHFACYVESEEDDAFYVRADSDPDGLSVTFLRWAE